MAAVSGKLEGVHYVLDRSKRTKAFKPTRRKPTLEELERAMALSIKSQRASDAIRKPLAESGQWEMRPRLEERSGHGKPADVLAYVGIGLDRSGPVAPIPPNFYRLALAAELEARKGERKPKRKAKAKPRKVEPKPAKVEAAPVIAFTDSVAFRMSKAELRELASNPATAGVAERELARRKAKRAAKREELVTV